IVIFRRWPVQLPEEQPHHG
ncbi:hypothetical protein, partial [Cronobacter sakazakii]